jgi:hypothetical protein
VLHAIQNVVVSLYLDSVPNIRVRQASINRGQPAAPTQHQKEARAKCGKTVMLAHPITIALIVKELRVGSKLGATLKDG